MGHGDQTKKRTNRHSRVVIRVSRILALPNTRISRIVLGAIVEVISHRDQSNDQHLSK
jgi:hypothetical protein